MWEQKILLVLALAALNLVAGSGAFDVTIEVQVGLAAALTAALVWAGVRRAPPAAALLIAVAPLFATLWGGCVSFPEIQRIEGAAAVVGEPSPTSTAIGVTLYTDDGSIFAIGSDVGLVEPITGSVCIEWHDAGDLHLSACVYCDETGCELAPSPPQVSPDPPEIRLMEPRS